jgi:hypothetical protein
MPLPQPRKTSIYTSLLVVLWQVVLLAFEGSVQR